MLVQRRDTDKVAQGGRESAVEIVVARVAGKSRGGVDSHKVGDKEDKETIGGTHHEKEIPVTLSPLELQEKIQFLNI